uniref:Uncharacterized protein n=1 Tax=Amphimedon queenslandica TaxID=400682 RepID=A0A1X7V1I0_AMPQE
MATGRRGAACVKADRFCVNCLPGCLGRCENRQTNSSSTVSPSTTPPPLSTAVLSDGVYHSPALCSLLLSPPNSEPSHLPQSVPSLPFFPPFSSPSFSWGDMEGADCCCIISEYYCEAVHWHVSFSSSITVRL